MSNQTFSVAFTSLEHLPAPLPEFVRDRLSIREQNANLGDFLKGYCERIVLYHSCRELMTSTLNVTSTNRHWKRTDENLPFTMAIRAEGDFFHTSARITKQTKNGSKILEKFIRRIYKIPLKLNAKYTTKDGHVFELVIDSEFLPKTPNSPFSRKITAIIGLLKEEVLVLKILKKRIRTVFDLSEGFLFLAYSRIRAGSAWTDSYGDGWLDMVTSAAYLRIMHKKYTVEKDTYLDYTGEIIEERGFFPRYLFKNSKFRTRFCNEIIKLVREWEGVRNKKMRLLYEELRELNG